MAIKQKKVTLSDKARELLQDALGRVGAAYAAEHLWQRVLTGKQRRKLGGDLQEAYSRHGTVGMWMQLHPVSRLVAIVQVAYSIGFFDEQTRDFLLRELGEKKPTDDSVNLPSWNTETGQLKFAGRQVRRVRVRAKQSNIQVVLDAFEAAEWPNAIPNPLRDGDPKSLHEAARSLNSGLKRLRFRVQEGGRAIRWELVNSHRTPNRPR